MNDILIAINQNREWLHAEEMSPEERRKRSDEVRELRHRLAHTILQAKTVDPDSKVEFLR